MTTTHRLRTTLIATIGAGALALTGCSSSGGGSAPSEQQIVNKLKTDSEVKGTLTSSVGDNASALNLLYGCIAKAMRSDADAGDVTDYVNGKKTIDEVGQTKSDSKLKADLTKCAQNGVAKGSVTPSSAPSS